MPYTQMAILLLQKASEKYVRDKNTYENHKIK